MSARLSRRLNRFSARVLLGVMLFVQALMGAHACSPGERAASFGAVAEAAVAHCHEESAASSQPSGRDACLTHCSLSEQALDTPQAAVFALPATPLLVLPATADGAEVRWLALLRSDDVAGGDPPIPILFQVFRN